MSEVYRGKRREATGFFKLGVKATKAGIHRALNRPPKGQGWVQCVKSPAGVMCRPEKVREAIEHFARAYQTFPDIVALNQIALGHEMLGEFEAARRHFARIREQAPPRAFPRMSKPQSSGWRV
jgi:tetratricopeptide (TPR) repeat protein